MKWHTDTDKNKIVVAHGWFRHRSVLRSIITDVVAHGAVLWRKNMESHDPRNFLGSSSSKIGLGTVFISRIQNGAKNSGTRGFPWGVDIAERPTDVQI